MRATLYAIEGPWPGKLSITPRPRGGDWLADEVAAWKAAGLDVIVSALEADESAGMELAEEQAEARKLGIEFVSYPIPDRGTPASLAECRELFRRLHDRLKEGKRIAVHCRQGIGRSSLISAALLTLAGVAAEEAWRRVEAGRGCSVPDTPEQRAWVERFARSVLAEN